MYGVPRLAEVEEIKKKGSSIIVWRPSLPVSHSYHKRLLDTMLNVDPEKRATFDELLVSLSNPSVWIEGSSKDQARRAGQFRMYRDDIERRDMRIVLLLRPFWTDARDILLSRDAFVQDVGTYVDQGAQSLIVEALKKLHVEPPDPEHIFAANSRLDPVKLRTRELNVDTVDSEDGGSAGGSDLSTPGEDDFAVAEFGLHLPEMSHVPTRPKGSLVFPGAAYIVDVNLEYHSKDHQSAQWLGEGAYGEVFQLVPKSPSDEVRPVACKYMWIEPSMEVSIWSERLFLFLSEVFALLDTPNHPAILPICGWNIYPYMPTPTGVILTPFMKNNYLNIENFMKNASDEDKNTGKMIVMYGVARGMRFMHHHQIVHWDLKPENSLLDCEYQPCVGVFGIARYLAAGNAHATARCGTGAYMAPEMDTLDSDDVERSTSVDVYSYAIICAELIAAKR
jgi:serine/threonine protein kinase